MSEPFIVHPTDAAGLDLGAFAASVLATSEQTDGAFSLLLTQREPPDFGPPLHLHRGAAEAFYVLGGEYLMFVEDRVTECPPGTFVYVPPDTAHTFKVISSEPGMKLNLFSPAAMVEFFTELAEAESRGDSSMELLNAISARAGMEILGPVPDTYLPGNPHGA